MRGRQAHRQAGCAAGWGAAEPLPPPAEAGGPVLWWPHVWALQRQAASWHLAPDVIALLGIRLARGVQRLLMGGAVPAGGDGGEAGGPQRSAGGGRAKPAMRRMVGMPRSPSPAVVGVLGGQQGHLLLQRQLREGRGRCRECLGWAMCHRPPKPWQRAHKRWERTLKNWRWASLMLSTTTAGTPWPVSTANPEILQAWSKCWGASAADKSTSAAILFPGWQLMRSSEKRGMGAGPQAPRRPCKGGAALSQLVAGRRACDMQGWEPPRQCCSLCPSVLTSHTGCTETQRPERPCWVTHLPNAHFGFRRMFARRRLRPAGCIKQAP